MSGPTPPGAPPRPAASRPTLTGAASALAPSAGTAARGLTMTVLTGFTTPLSSLAWAPDGRLLAAASGDRATPGDPTVRLWHPDGSPAVTFRGHTAGVFSLAWAPDGTLLASGSQDQTVRLWRPDGTLVRTIAAGAGTVFSLAWAPDSQTIAAASIITFPNPTVQLWRPDGTLQHTMHTDGSGGKFFNLAWSPDGQRLAGGATDYKLWMKDGMEISHSREATPGWALAWAPDSTYWATGDENGSVAIHDTTGRIVHHAYNEGNVDALAWAPAGRLLAGGDGVHFWRADGTTVVTHAGLRVRVNCVAWAPDGHLLASGGDDQTVRLWRADGTLVAALTGHAAPVTKVAWAPDGRSLASGAADGSVRLWYVPRGAAP